MSKLKYELPIYFLMVLLATVTLCISILSSGVLPDQSLNTIEKLTQHIKGLKFENLFWIISLPGVIGLILLKRRGEFVSFFIKMFYIFLAVMFIPVALGFWSIFSETNTLPTIVVLALGFLTWVILSAIGAFGMAQREYVFGGHKRDTAWRVRQNHDR